MANPVDTMVANDTTCDIHDKRIPDITISTTDITAGSTALSSGSLYFVYG